ncbi:MAG: M12 family metallo-peptidase, partial [Bacteroidota bacterium]
INFIKITNPKKILDESFYDFEIFDKTIVTKNVLRKKSQINDRYEWVGKGENNETIILSVGVNGVTGTIRDGSELYKIEPLEGDVHVLIKINEGAYPPEHPIDRDDGVLGKDNLLKGKNNENQERISEPNLITSDEEDEYVIDLLVAYTPAAASAHGDILGLIQTAVTETNQSYENSGMSLRVNLVRTISVSYTESGDYDTDLSRFQGTSDGYMDEIHNIRNRYGADVCVLIFNNDDYCGMASRIAPVNDANTAFCEVYYDCATGYYSFAHEIGHLQGARHNLGADPTLTPYQYGHGYVYPSGGWRTIMAYNASNCLNGYCTRLQYWSNPDILYNGIPMGGATYEDNSRLLDETSNIVAGLKPTNNNLYVPEQYSTLSSALSSAQSGQTVIVTGTQTVSGYFQVNAGITLQLDPGSSLLFNSSSTRLLVYGNLNVLGNSSSRVTIDGQGYSRSSMTMATIVVASGGSANIQYADFKNAAYELTLWYNTGTVTAQNCTFTNFGYTTSAQAISIYSKTTGTATISSTAITGSNSQGIGIYSYNTGTNIAISNNTISSAGTGICVYSSNAFITSNVISNNISYGIQADNVSTAVQYQGNDIKQNGYGISLNSSSPWIMSNIIRSNGLNVLINSSSPNFATSTEVWQGYNTIAYAGAPLLRAQYSSHPYLGYDFDGGYNSIFMCDLPHLWVTNNSGVYAANNYWGEEGPSYYADGTSWALVTDPLNENPNPDPGYAYKLGFVPTNLKMTSSVDTSEDKKTFQNALRLAFHGDFINGKQDLLTLIDKSTSKYAVHSLMMYYDLTKLELSLQTSERSPETISSELTTLLTTFQNKQTHHLLRPFALRLLARHAAWTNDLTTANNFYSELIQKYPNTEHELTSLHDQVAYYVEVEQDIKKANDLLNRMKEAYPDDRLTIMARIRLGEKISLKELEENKQIPTESKEEVTRFELSSAYPNPFNPVTTISFELPSDGHVSLVVYDMLGREVAQLVNGNKESGKHTVTFNGNALSSGVYFYRLESQKSVVVKKMILTK